MKYTKVDIIYLKLDSFYLFVCLYFNGTVYALLKPFLSSSHEGFLLRYVQYLKDIKFLREDLVFSIHSTEASDFPIFIILHLYLFIY